MAAVREGNQSFSAPVSATGSKLKGHPVQIVNATDEHNFELNEAVLEEILHDERVKDQHVVVVSVAGAFRKGKSFLLDFFLRYLQSPDHEDWLGDDTCPLEGFPWRGGAERETTGILLWSEPFPCELPNGDKVVVLLMDTQGAFDDQSTVKDCATIFALSTMISSVQVFNITSNIQEDDLQHLQLFTEYGRLALEGSGSKPFQALWFLVRDWSYPYQYEYGSDGGNKLLDKRLQIGDRQHPELQQLREHIRSCFAHINCFLMPHPGLKVATSPVFDGKLADIEPDFRDMLRTLVPLLLEKKNLVIKEIHGSKITGKELVAYFKAYINIYQGDQLPEPKSMLLATAEANNLAAVANARDLYTKEMEAVCGGDKPYMHPDQLEREHKNIEARAVDLFSSTKKMGGADFSQTYMDKLQAELAEQYENFLKHNESKNIFAAARTPAVLFTVMVICYVLSGMIGMLGLYTIADVMNLVMGIALVLLCTWTYIRYSGEHRDIGSHIDSLAEFIWENGLGQVIMKVAQGGASQAVSQATKDKKQK